MKRNSFTFFVVAMTLSFLGVSPGTNAANLLTFDDLSPGSGGGSVLIANGYRGFQWNNFGVIDGFFRPASEGYHTGLISPDNVAFNQYGSPASISSPTPFNLDSAYLTAAFVNNMTVEVQGFSNGAPAFDDFYAISNTAPTLVNFNPAGVTHVNFIATPASQFALDNLTVLGGITNTNGNPPPPPGGLVEVGTVQVTNIGHVFDTSLGELGGPLLQPNSMRDYLIDQGQVSGGGALLPSVSVNWDTNSQFTVTFAAPAGEKFLVQVPAGQSAAFAGYLWWQSTRGGFSGPGPVAVNFDGLQGAPPDFAGSSAELSSSDGYFGCVNIQSGGITNDLSFTSMTITGTVPPQVTGLGTLDFSPHPNSSLQLVCSTYQTNDPGPFVSLVPVAQSIPHITMPQPAARMTVQPNGDIAVTFTGGVLQCAADPRGTFVDVPGTGSGICTIPRSSQTVQQFFRVR